MNLNDASVGILCELERLGVRLDLIQDAEAGPVPKPQQTVSQAMGGLLGTLKKTAEVIALLHGKVDFLQDHLNHQVSGPATPVGIGGIGGVLSNPLAKGGSR